MALRAQHVRCDCAPCIQHIVTIQSRAKPECLRRDEDRVRNVVAPRREGVCEVDDESLAGACGYGQFSKFHVCFCGLDSGNLKFETVRTNEQRMFILGFETLNLNVCDLKL